MAALKKQAELQLDNPSEALAHVLVNFQEPYLELLDDGINRDAYQELGKTIRCIAQALSETFADVSNDEEDFDDFGDGDDD